MGSKVIGTTAADISSDTMRNNVTSAGGAMSEMVRF